nr:zinc finger matrin-type protein 4 [Pelodiscus sinensis]|eukprot:XP_025035608.1 zinc finger matrin-type protein 4 [Pelodiscus sinensis]
MAGNSTLQSNTHKIRMVIGPQAERDKAQTASAACTFFARERSLGRWSTRPAQDSRHPQEMKSSDIDQELFTESYCKVCSAQLISESQRVAHYESRKHASKVRLYYMLHPIDGGCPAKKLRSENGSDADSVDKNKCCTLCNMSFTSAVVAESHYQGKIHAKRLKLLLGEQPAIKATESTLSSLKQPHADSSPVVSSPHQRRDSDRYCQLCAAWFNNPMMAQQHYDGKKHKKNAARADLLEQLGKTLDLGELRGLKRSYTCNICNVTLNSIEQYHAHLKGSKHQTKSFKVRSEFWSLSAELGWPRLGGGARGSDMTGIAALNTEMYRKSPAYERGVSQNLKNQ